MNSPYLRWLAAAPALILAACCLFLTAFGITPGPSSGVQALVFIFLAAGILLIQGVVPLRIYGYTVLSFTAVLGLYAVPVLLFSIPSSPDKFGSALGSFGPGGDNPLEATVAFIGNGELTPVFWFGTGVLLSTVALILARKAERRLLAAIPVGFIPGPPTGDPEQEEVVLFAEPRPKAPPTKTLMVISIILASVGILPILLAGALFLSIVNISNNSQAGEGTAGLAGLVIWVFAIVVGALAAVASPILLVTSGAMLLAWRSDYPLSPGGSKTAQIFALSFFAIPVLAIIGAFVAWNIYT